MKQYYVYIMTNFTNTTLYIGVTNNVARRAFEHKAKLIPGFIKRYNLNKLIYFEVFKDIKEAITREKTLKNLVRREKDELINNNNPEWKDLFDEIV